jgi:hypothetical protein
MPALQIICRPLESWPGEPTPANSRRKDRPFKVNFEKSVTKLKKELRRIDTTVAVLGTAHAEKDISVSSGLPRFDKSPSHPGVMVAADTKFGSLKWFTDVFSTWPNNLHAIALTLERLRLADLYGVTKRGEQYSGWKMLPGPITAGSTGSTGSPQATMTMEAAARFVAEQGRKFGAMVTADQLIGHKSLWQEAYRKVAAKLHPDASKDDAIWAKLQDAATLLNSLHNRK